MPSPIQAVRGMKDIVPSEVKYWQFLESTVSDLLSSYGYEEIRFPVLEKTELFKRSIGEVTDIVEKEMYSFDDRNGDSLSLRPEGTAVCVRAAIEKGLLYNQIQKLWYMGPMFRHERPQKGRYRQFHQIGVEVFGLTGPDIDAELILLTRRLWKKLGLLNNVRLEINTLGSLESRQKYRVELIAFLTSNQDRLDEDSKKRIQSNPLRVLDSKSPQTQEILSNAPRLMDFMDEESKNHFNGLLAYLDNNEVDYQINPRLVRGLDYYSNTVFEWITEDLGAQGTVCAGGRFDSLVEYLGGKPTPAIGFAMGMERLISLLEDNADISINVDVDCFMIMLGNEARVKGLQLAESVHNALPQLKLLSNCGGGSMKSQMKKADKSGAKIAIILGEEEIKNQQVVLKYLRAEKDQVQCNEDQLIEMISTYIF